MSAAFRNFILTLVIMLALFGYVAYKSLPDLSDMLFSDEEESSEEVSEAIADASEEESESKPEETSSEEPVTEKRVFNCVFAAKNDSGEICSLIYVNVNEATGKYVTCRIPVDMYVKENAIYKKISTYFGVKDGDFIAKKVSPLVGIDIDYYVICNSSSFAAFADVAETNGFEIKVDLPYMVRYLDPAFEDMTEIEEEYYVKIAAGKQTLTSENASYIFNSQKDSSAVKSYDFQESMGISVMRQIASAYYLSGSVDTLNYLRNSVDTNIPVDQMIKLAPVFFSYGTESYTTNHITYSTSYDYDNSEIKIPNWVTAISAIKEAIE